MYFDECQAQKGYTILHGCPNVILPLRYFLTFTDCAICMSMIGSKAYTKSFQQRCSIKSSMQSCLWIFSKTSKVVCATCRKFNKKLYMTSILVPCCRKRTTCPSLDCRTQREDAIRIQSLGYIKNSVVLYNDSPRAELHVIS